jgi:hypothetical protein
LTFLGKTSLGQVVVSIRLLFIVAVFILLFLRIHADL